MPDAEVRPAVLVTGSSTGIGRAVALAAARTGWRVFGGVRRPEDGAALKLGMPLPRECTSPQEKGGGRLRRGTRFFL